MTQNLKVVAEDGKLFEDPKKYNKLVGNLNYLTITRIKGQLTGIVFLLGVIWYLEEVKSRV